MKQTAYILFLTILLSSCATSINRPYKNVTIYTTEPSKIVYKQDTVETKDNKAHKYDKSNNKGELGLHLSLPHFNFFNLTPQREQMKVGTSFWGLTVGLDYYHSKNQFVNFGGSYAFGLPFPIPAAIDFTGERELMSSRYISVSNNHKLCLFTAGYGLSFGKNIWDFGYYSLEEELPPTKDPITKSHYAFGLVFPIYFQLSEHFNIGVVYRPTFYRPNMADKFEYEHLISIDFAWKIGLKK